MDTDNALAELLRLFARRGELSLELEAVDVGIANARGVLGALRSRDAAAAAASADRQAASDGPAPSIQ